MQQDVWYLDNVDMNTVGRPEDRREHDRVRARSTADVSTCSTRPSASTT